MKEQVKNWLQNHKKEILIGVGFVSGVGIALLVKKRGRKSTDIRTALETSLDDARQKIMQMMCDSNVLVIFDKVDDNLEVLDMKLWTEFGKELIDGYLIEDKALIKGIAVCLKNAK